MEREPLYVGCDLHLEFRRARAAGAFINDGTCAYVLADPDGVTVDSGSMSYVTGSQGVYRATIDGDDTAAFTVGAVYTATITFTAPGGIDDSRVIEYVAQYRGAT